MFENLLVAVDSSPTADHVVDIAADLASKLGAKAVILHVRPHLIPMGRVPLTTELEPASIATEMVDRLAGVFRDRGVPVSTDLIHAQVDRVADEIKAAAATLGSDLIVMGSHSRGAIGHLFLGSTAYHVLHSATVPVLIVR